jgi:hypothetical protein
MAVLVCICGRCPQFRHIKVGHGIRRNLCLPNTLTPLLLTCQRQQRQGCQRRGVIQSALSQRCVYLLCPLEIPEPSDCITECLFVLKPVGPMKAGGDKNARNRPIGLDDKRDWSFGLFDCIPRCRLCKKKTSSTYSPFRMADPIF